MMNAALRLRKGVPGVGGVFSHPSYFELVVDRPNERQMREEVRGEGAAWAEGANAGAYVGGGEVSHIWGQTDRSVQGAPGWGGSVQDSFN